LLILTIATDEQRVTGVCLHICSISLSPAVM